MLANKGADAVIHGQFPSIIAYHCAQPGTKKFLEVSFSCLLTLEQVYLGSIIEYIPETPSKVAPIQSPKPKSMDGEHVGSKTEANDARQWQSDDDESRCQ